MSEKSILCITHEDNNYCFEIDCVVEICKDVVVQSIPGQPSYFYGVFYYEGEFVPVINMSRQPVVQDERYYLDMALVLRWEDEVFAAPLTSKPQLWQVSEEHKIKNITGIQLVKDGWVHEVYKKEERLLLVVNIERIVKRLKG